MMRALYSGQLGVKSHQSKMDVVGNNISNVNTTGFKSSRTTFADVLSQKMKDASSSNGEIGSTNPIQIGLGDQVARIDTIFRDGAPMVTGKNTDLCLSGDGLFVVKYGNETYYTRNGAFEFDAEGNYVLPSSGHFVQGWMAKDGVIDTTAATEDIKITKGQPLIAVKDVELTGISEATSEPLPVSIGGKQFYVDGIPSDGKTWSYKDDVPLGATTAVIENEDGNTAMVRFSPAATFELPKGQDVEGVTNGLTKGSVTEQYPLTVNIDGKQYTAINMDKDWYKSNWVLKSDGAIAGNNTITVTDGTNDVTFTLDSPLEESIGLSQETTVNDSEENPVTTVATLQSVQIESSGIITGIYTNGERRPEAQVALAHFDNSMGLLKTGTSLYQESANSGEPITIEAGEFETVITPGALEMSNVDVANEFADMIITQRGFQSNTKIITVGDQMIETAVNMKR